MLLYINDCIPVEKSCDTYRENIVFYHSNVMSQDLPDGIQRRKSSIETVCRGDGVNVQRRGGVTEDEGRAT